MDKKAFKMLVIFKMLNSLFIQKYLLSAYKVLATMCGARATVVNTKYKSLLLGCAMLCLIAQWCPFLCDPMDCSPPCFSVHGDSPGKNSGVGYHALLQGIFPTQGSNPGLAHCRWIFYHLSHQGSPQILEWVAHSFSKASSKPRNRTGVSCIAGRFFTSWAIREVPTWGIYSMLEGDIENKTDHYNVMWWKFYWMS